MEHQPPKLAMQFLKWFCREDMLETIEGDLCEEYQDYVETHGSLKANKVFYWTVFRSIRPYLIKKQFIHPFIRRSMLKSYLKTGIRNLKKESAYSLINIFGLSMGICCFLLAAFFIADDLSFDRFYYDAEKIFRVNQITEWQGEEEHEGMTNKYLAEEMKTQIPEVAHAVAIWAGADSWVKANDKRFFEKDFILASGDFFNVFNQEFVQGSPVTAFKDSTSVVLTESYAKKYFNTTYVLGEVIEFQSYGNFVVTGVVKDLPNNTHMPFDMVLASNFNEYYNNVSPFYQRWSTSWYGRANATFVKLKEATKSKAVGTKLDAILPNYMDERYLPKASYLQALTDIHLAEEEIHYGVNRVPTGEVSYLLILGALASFILLVAIINYVNLATARAFRRYKEIGVRKNMGATRAQLFWQFIIEAMLTVFISGFLAFVLISLVLPYFNILTGKDMAYHPEFLSLLVLITIPSFLLISFLGGTYPAFVLARQGVIDTLKNFNTSSKLNLYLRNTLVTFQFVMALVLIFATLVASEQIDFIVSKSLGFETEQIMVMEVNGGGVRNNYATFKAEILSNPDILEVAGVSTVVGGFRSPNKDLIRGYGESEEEAQEIATYGFDDKAFKVLDLKIRVGNQFSGNTQLDSTSVIINETYAKQLLQQKGEDDKNYHVLIGEVLIMGEEQTQHVKIIGIAEDFHFMTLHEKIQPLLIGHLNNPFFDIDDIILKISGQHTGEVITFLDKLNQQYEPNAQMTLNFLDDMVQSRYEADKNFKRIFTICGIISVVIAVLGIIGLTAYLAEKRNKEFSVRKVLGAGHSEILMLQAKGFLFLIGLSVLLAVPVAWWAAKGWLSNFAYKVNIDLLWLPIAGFSLLIIIVATVSLVSLRVIRANPAEVLRTE